jgi:hypothetical protein
MKNRFILSIVLILFISYSGNGQKSNSGNKKKLVITGVVKGVNEAPIANAQIYVDSVYSKQLSDNLGNYRVVANPDSKKIFAYSPKAGYCEAEINGQKTIDLVLNTKTLILPRFITENKMVPAEKKPKPNKVNIYTDIFQMIRQEVPGVVVSGRSIMIQGPNSFLGSHEPLYVVDGNIVPGIDYVNPQEVKSIRLLTGSQASLYGTEGTNGVISITLIKGGDR